MQQRIFLKTTQVNILPLVFIIRVFLALSEDPKDRGTIVAHGGGKVKEEISNLGSNAAQVNLVFKQTS